MNTPPIPDRNLCTAAEIVARMDSIIRQITGFAPARYRDGSVGPQHGAQDRARLARLWARHDALSKRLKSI